MAVKKAWIGTTREQPIIEVPPGQHHEEIIGGLEGHFGNIDDVFDEGWIRVTVRDSVLDIDGRPQDIEDAKSTILVWAGPQIKWINVDYHPEGDTIEISPETFEEESVPYMIRRARMLGATVFRRRPVGVRQYRRRRR